MERETKEIITPIDKHKVVLKAWITGREKRKLREPFLARMKFAVDRTGAQPVTKDIDTAKMVEEAENVAIKTIVISVDGSTENVVDKILDMKEKDYEFVMQEIGKIGEDAGFTKP